MGNLALARTYKASSDNTVYLYVNSATGDDSRTRAQAMNSSTPWLTIGRAAWGSQSYTSPNASEAAQAGDIVRIEAGIYWENGYVGGAGPLLSPNPRYSVALNPANSGTVNNPITFRGIGDVYIRLNNGIRGPMIGSQGRNYIIWDNFIIDDTYGGSYSDTGPVVFSSCTGSQLINSRVTGHAGSYYWGYLHRNAFGATATSSGTTITGSGSRFHTELIPGNIIVANGQTRTVATVTNAGLISVTVAPDPPWNNEVYFLTGYYSNYCLVRLDSANFCLVRNNSISRVHVAGSGRGYNNEACVMSYNSNDNIIEHNEIHDCGVGVFIKGIHEGYTQDRNIIRFNLVYNCNHVGLRSLGSADSKIYQNIVHSCSGNGLRAGDRTSTRSRWINNTLYNNTQNILPQTTELIDNHFKNNLVVNGEFGFYNLSVADPSLQDLVIDRNLYFGQTVQLFRWNADGVSLNIPFSTWQSTYGHDLNGMSGSDPLFVNGGGSFALATDFKLQGGSPALTLGRVVEGIGGNNDDVIPAGAYITGNETIGPVNV